MSQRGSDGGDRGGQRGGQGRGGKGRGGAGRDGQSRGSGGRGGSRGGGQDRGGKGRDGRRDGGAGGRSADGPPAPERGAPAGIERARASATPPPVPLRHRSKQASEATAPPEPRWPADPTVDLPRGVQHELRGQVRGNKDLLERVMQALTIGGDAIDEGEPEIALTYLEWAKHHAPRSSAIREALGIARYLTEDFAGAITELQAYRRMTGHKDQNHVIADCLRATDGSTARIGELIGEMEPKRDGEDRFAEGVIVWASALADSGDIGAGRAVLRRLLPEGATRSERPDEHVLRLWYVAGDLAERAGDRDEAESWFSSVAARGGDDWHDVEERLAALRRS